MSAKEIVFLCTFVARVRFNSPTLAQKAMEVGYGEVSLEPGAQKTQSTY